MANDDDDLPPLGEGDLLAEKYRIERVLGVGGVGVVVAAVHVALGQRVALKFLRASAAHDRASVERFLREARAVVRLKSQHAIRVQDVGTLAGGEPYMVMELLEGCDFATLLEERGRLPVPEAVAYVLQACEALAEAHAVGIVHRDLKPENLFLTTGVDHLPLVKVLDFGLVKEINANAATLPSGKSLTGALVMGTPTYMSPEQIKATRDVDARADIWSLGVVLYELVSGQVPFVAESLPELIASVVRDTPRPLTEVAPGVPRGLSDIVGQCLEKDPAKRFQKISRLAAALDAFAMPLTTGAGARLGLVQPSTAPPPTPPIAWRPASLTLEGAKRAGAVTLETLAEIPSPALQLAARSDSEELPTGKSRLPVWPFLIGAAAVIGGIAYFATRAPQAATAVVVSPLISGESTPSSNDAGAATPTFTALSPAASTTPSHVSPSADRTPGVIPSSVPSTTSKPITTPKNHPGGHDAGTNEGRLLDTR